MFQRAQQGSKGLTHSSKSASPLNLKQWITPGSWGPPSRCKNHSRTESPGAPYWIKLSIQGGPKPPGCGHGGPHIELWIGKMHGLTHGFWGTRFSNKPMRAACCWFNEHVQWLRELLSVWGTEVLCWFSVWNEFHIQWSPPSNTKHPNGQTRGFIPD